MSSIINIPNINNITNNITSIIPKMIFSLVLIIGWLPVIILTEKNNKGNSDEYKLLLDKLKTAIFTDVTNEIKFNTDSNFTNNAISKLPNSMDRTTFNGLNYNNLYITYNVKRIKTDSKGFPLSDNKGNYIREIIDYKEVVNNGISINNISMDDENYKYLAMQTMIFSNDTVKDNNDSNLSYDIKIYTIPKNKEFVKVERLKEFQTELDMNIYNYEFGPRDNAILAIKNRKKSSDTVQKWLGRIGTFLMLFIGLSLLVLPLSIIIAFGDSLPGPLKLLILPGKIILSIYNTLSLFGSLLLTLIMTFLVWTIINKPMISVLVASLLVGLIIYFNKLK